MDAMALLTVLIQVSSGHPKRHKYIAKMHINYGSNGFAEQKCLVNGGGCEKSDMWSGHERRTLKMHKKLEKQLISCENSRFCWSEWGDSNSRRLEPKSFI